MDVQVFHADFGYFFLILLIPAMLLIFFFLAYFRNLKQERKIEKEKLELEDKLSKDYNVYCQTCLKYVPGKKKYCILCGKPLAD